MTGEFFLPISSAHSPSSPSRARKAPSLTRLPLPSCSLRCIQVIAGVLGKAGQAGQQLRREAAEEGEVTFTPYQWRARPGEDVAKRKARI